MAPASTEKVTYQPSLFRDASGGPKVIPIPTLTPARLSGREDMPTPRRVAARPPAQRPGARRAPGSQQSLEFSEVAGRSRQLGMQVEAVIYCDAPVALASHRVIAAAFDATMVMLGAGLFWGIFLLSGAPVGFTRQTAPFFLGVVAVLALFYRFLWCVADGDTPGMRAAGLRLVDFDGRPPDREQRGMRQVAALLSVLSAGLGLVWALVDEESLTWHDHISKTFPTPL